MGALNEKTIKAIMKNNQVPEMQAHNLLRKEMIGRYRKFLLQKLAVRVRRRNLEGPDETLSMPIIKSIAKNNLLSETQTKGLRKLDVLKSGATTNLVSRLPVPPLEVINPDPATILVPRQPAPVVHYQWNWN